MEARHDDGRRPARGPGSGDLPDGDYAWTIGLFTPCDGRLRLEGVEDSSGRIRLGTLRVNDGGRKLVFSPERDTDYRRAAIYMEHVNQAGKIVDFGPERTDGSVLISSEGSAWVARTFPRDRAFSLLMDPGRFGRPAEIRCSGGRAQSVEPVAEGEFWRLPLVGASQYRWDAR